MQYFFAAEREARVEVADPFSTDYEPIGACLHFRILSEGLAGCTEAVRN